MSAESGVVYENAPLWPWGKKGRQGLFLNFILILFLPNQKKLSKRTVLAAFQAHTHRFPAGIAQQALNRPKCGEKALKWTNWKLKGQSPFQTWHYMGWAWRGLLWKNLPRHSIHSCWIWSQMTNHLGCFSSCKTQLHRVSGRNIQLYISLHTLSFHISRH